MAPDHNASLSRYQLRDLAGAISSFEASIAHTPPEIKPSFPDPDAPTPELTPAQAILADTHTNLGAAYILSQPPNAEKALEHLQKALMMNPDDGEVCYNLAAVLEATGQLDDALIAYERSIKLGIERAAVNVRNVRPYISPLSSFLPKYLPDLWLPVTRDPASIPPVRD